MLKILEINMKLLDQELIRSLKNAKENNDFLENV